MCGSSELGKQNIRNDSAIVNKDSNTILKLYQSLVRPKLDYCVQPWRPYLLKEKDRPIRKGAEKSNSDND